MYTVSWFSAGVSSALATKLLIDEIDEIIYTHIENQHGDTLRFVKDCEAWFAKPITILESPYKSVQNVVLARRFIRGPHGAPCTEYLKRRVRKEWECDHSSARLRYVWGMDASKKEMKRADALKDNMPQFDHAFPLIDRGISKAEAHRVLRASGISRPAMYELGYHNNNCVGCVKGGMGYWNKIRVDFPEVFDSMAKLEREIGASCISGMYLDALDPSAGRRDGPILDDCGIFCEMAGLQ